MRKVVSGFFNQATVKQNHNHNSLILKILLKINN